MKLRDIDERKLTGGEKRSKEAHFKKLKKHKKDFTDRYGDEGESVMHAIATKRAKGESVIEAKSKQLHDIQWPDTDEDGDSEMATHAMNAIRHNFPAYDAYSHVYSMTRHRD